METPAEEGQDEKLIFADNKVTRDFSNQQAAGTNEETIEPVPGTPYVPSVSLSYEAVPGTYPGRQYQGYRGTKQDNGYGN